MWNRRRQFRSVVYDTHKLLPYRAGLADFNRLVIGLRGFQGGHDRLNKKKKKKNSNTFNNNEYYLYACNDFKFINIKKMLYFMPTLKLQNKYTR